MVKEHEETLRQARNVVNGKLLKEIKLDRKVISEMDGLDVTLEKTIRILKDANAKLHQASCNEERFDSLRYRLFENPEKRNDYTVIRGREIDTYPDQYKGG